MSTGKQGGTGKNPTFNQPNRRTVWTFWLGSILLCSLCVPAKAQEAVGNGDFLAGSLGWTPWFAGVEFFDFVYNSNNGPAGGVFPCVEVWALSSDPFGQPLAGLWQQVQLEPGEVYTLSARSRLLFSDPQTGFAKVLLGTQPPTPNVPYENTPGTIVLAHWNGLWNGGLDSAVYKREAFQASAATMYLLLEAGSRGMSEEDIAAVQVAFDNISILPGGVLPPDADNDGVPDEYDQCPGTIPNISVDTAGCPPVIPFDYDRDGDVDPADLDGFLTCLTGPAVAGPPAGCDLAAFEISDADDDADVDQSDFGFLQRCMSGPDVPARADCAD